MTAVEIQFAWFEVGNLRLIGIMILESRLIWQKPMLTVISVLALMYGEFGEFWVS